MCSTRTWTLLEEANACLAYVSCPTCVSRSWCLLLACCAFVRLISGHFLSLDVILGSLTQLMLLEFLLHRLFVILPGHKVRSMECNATSGLSFQIWTVMRPNLSMKFLRDSIVVCLSQTDQGSRDHAVKSARCILRINMIRANNQAWKLFIN